MMGIQHDAMPLWVLPVAPMCREEAQNLPFPMRAMQGYSHTGWRVSKATFIESTCMMSCGDYAADLSPAAEQAPASINHGEEEERAAFF
jgi:hypothetical protein